MRRNRENEAVAEVEKAKTRLKQGLQRSRALVADYRSRLAVLGCSGMPKPDRLKISRG